MPMRAAIAIVATVFGVILLFAFQPPESLNARPRQALVSSASPSPTQDVTTPPSPTVSGRYKDGTYTGDDYQMQFGDVQVKVIVSGGKISDVQALQMPYDRQRSYFISQQAAPLLHDEVIQAQSANIDSLSGATYTADAYAQSVQSALDQAHN